jgi:uncharacterized protein (DUF302 family)/uncharacterized membrane protein YidH (DUF202 family)
MSTPSDYLAAERTYLAWIRTGLALMGFGFVVARFGIYIQALAHEGNLPTPRNYGLSVPLGTVLIAIGVAVHVGSTWNYVRVIGVLKRGGEELARPSRLGIGVAAALTALGLGMVIALTFFATDARGQTTMSADNGIVSVPSSHSVDETVDAIQKILNAKGVHLFAVVDHSGQAKAAGLTMRPTKLVIFGNPKGGTPLMVASPSIAIDLPLKLLVAEDANGKVWISYNAPAYIAARHNLPKELMPPLAAVEGIAAEAGK